MVQDPK
jgi:hypothetical protein